MAYMMYLHSHMRIGIVQRDLPERPQIVKTSVSSGIDSGVAFMSSNSTLIPESSTLMPQIWTG